MAPSRPEHSPTPPPCSNRRPAAVCIQAHVRTACCKHDALEADLTNDERAEEARLAAAIQGGSGELLPATQRESLRFHRAR